MSKTQISDPSVIVNNVGIAIVPNSLSFTEGFGEQDVLVQSAGGGVLEQVYANNVETNLAMVKFALRATVENIALARQWKANANRNVIAVTAQVAEGSLTRTFNNAALTGDYEVGLSADGTLELEFKADKATV